jgi:hypothetical protein
MFHAKLLANGTTMTRAELMRHALSQARRKVHVIEILFLGILRNHYDEC